MMPKINHFSSKRNLPAAYVSYYSIPLDLPYCKKVDRMLHEAIRYLPDKETNNDIVVVCLQKTRPVEDLDGALEDFTDDELRRMYFVYIITDDQYVLTKEDISADSRYQRYANIVKIYNYFTESGRNQVIDNLSKDLESRQART